MKILAIETSDRAGSIAIADGQRNLACYALAEDLRSAQSLAPAIKRALATVGWRASEIELVAIANGPGSFTGLRVGVVTAKSFAYAIGAQIMSVNTLHVIAEQAQSDATQLSVIIDAHRSELFEAQFERDAGGGWTILTDPAIVAAETWLDRLSSAQNTAVSGPALKKLLTHVPETVDVLSSNHWSPWADTVARLAWRQYQAGQRDDVWSIVPLYLRASAAEEKAEKKNGAAG